MFETKSQARKLERGIQERGMEEGCTTLSLTTLKRRTWRYPKSREKEMYERELLSLAVHFSLAQLSFSRQTSEAKMRESTRERDLSLP